MTFNTNNDSPWMTENIKDKINYLKNIFRENTKKDKDHMEYKNLENIIKVAVLYIVLLITSQL